MNNIVGALEDSERMSFGNWGDGALWVHFPKVAFLGDSITYSWDLPLYFKNPINAGIPGNTTQMMQERFLSDVASKHPEIVHIHGGINDICHVPGADLHWIEWITDYCANHGFKIILGTLLPNTLWNDVYTSWETGNAAVLAWNDAIKTLGGKNGWPVVDYYTPFINEDGTQISSWFLDGLHPTAAGQGLKAATLSPVLSAI
jgi:lysophospholipase L1-like esterase